MEGRKSPPHTPLLCPARPSGGCCWAPLPGLDLPCQGRWRPLRTPLPGLAPPGPTTGKGLKKFFTSLSQSTKQRLGRFRCYSMEQISAAGTDTRGAPEEPSRGTTSSPKMKKAPSLQSLLLVSPFNQPRKSSSVQNLHSLFGKTDRSSLYQLEEPKDGASVPDRKAGTHPRRSLSVEDIGSPNLVRTVGRVVEVFPDGTSQLELLRSPQGTFGFRVASGNGRPDTGVLLVANGLES
uniref:Uncharacterized protein n=1 Tax=Sphaerodactylus townsendi TaxID=933632 RepID=A0ACB8F389_9SAUR